MTFERIPEPSLDPPEAVVVCQCAECGDDIYFGEDLYRVCGKPFCPWCIASFKEEAE